MRYRFAGLGDDVIPVEGPGVTASDVITRIRLNNGSLTIADTGEYADVIRANPALFAVAQVRPGMIQVSEASNAASGDYSKLITYALLGVGALVLLRAIRG